jgi:hypothetical protein
MWRALSLLAATEVGGAVRRNVVIFMIYGLALIVFAAACGFLIAVAHALLAAAYGPIGASLIIAGVLLAVALGLMFVGFYMRHRVRRRGTMATAALVAAPLVAPAAIRTLAANATLGAGVVAGVVAIGALVGRQMGRNT